MVHHVARVSCLSQVLGRTEAAVGLHHATHGEPRHSHRLQDHERRGNRPGGDERTLQCHRFHGQIPCVLPLQGRSSEPQPGPGA